MRNAIRPLAAVAAIGLFAMCSSTVFAQSRDERVSTFTRADGTQVTVVSGQPKPASYGPKPAFEQLDVNHDGIITREEAEAYLPLLNDFDNLAHHVRGITPRMYARWDQR